MTQVFVTPSSISRLSTKGAPMAALALVVFALALLSPVSASAASRIIATSGTLTEMVYALGQGNHLIADDISSSYPEKAKKLPKIGYNRALSSEGILSLSPDLVLLSEDAGPPAVLKQLQAAHVNLQTFKKAHSFAQIEANLKQLAKTLGAESHARGLIKALRKDQSALKARLAKQKKHPSVLFILRYAKGAPMVAGKHTAADKIIKLSGATNAIKSYAGYKPVTPEAVAALKPDVILITDLALKQAGGQKTLLKNPGFALTPAAKQGRLIHMDTLLLLGFGPRTAKAALQLNQAYTRTHS